MRHEGGIVGVGSGIFKLLLVLHILCAIVGFGTVFLNGLYGREAKRRRGAEGLAITEANLVVAKVANLFIYAVFLLGVLLVLASDDAIQFSDGWVAGAMTLYVVGLGLSHGILLPNLRRIRDLQAELVTAGPPLLASDPPSGGAPPQALEMEQRGKTVGITSEVLHVLLVAVLVLMIWKP